jgi:hypothetical protein
VNKQGQEALNAARKLSKVRRQIIDNIILHLNQEEHGKYNNKNLYYLKILQRFHKSLEVERRTFTILILTFTPTAIHFGTDLCAGVTTG